MYLSKLVLNPGSLSVQRDLSNAHALHQRIMKGFPDEHRDNPRADWCVLYRLEPDSDVVLVQSEIVPDWSRLPEGYLQDLGTKSLALMIKQIQVGQILQFRLVANPSKRDKKSGKTIGLFKRVDQLAWLERQSGLRGFRLLSQDVVSRPNTWGRKNGSAPIKIETALFQGVLEITEMDPFFKSLRQGIGRGRSYGCGLLSLAKVQ